MSSGGKRRSFLWLPVLGLLGFVAAVSLAGPSAAAQADSDEIRVTARGRNGTETIDLLVNGAEVATWNLTTGFQDYSYQPPAGQEVTALRVGNNNSGGWPNAVIVDHVTVAGTQFDSSAPDTLSKGSWDSATGCAEGFKQSDWLTCNNSWFEYNIPDPGPGEGDVVSIRAKGRTGSEGLSLSVNGNVVASADLGTDFKTYTYELEQGALVGSLRVSSNSSGWPEAVVVDYVDFRGVRYDSSDAFSVGSWDSRSGCIGGLKQSDWLTCSEAYFEYSIQSDRFVTVVAKGRTGSENVDLLINGQEVASWDLTTEFQTFTHPIGEDDVIKELMARNNSGGWPKAVIVDYVELNRSRFESDNPYTLSSGSWDSATGCAEGFKSSDWLTCNNSWFRYNVFFRDLTTASGATFEQWTNFRFAECHHYMRPGFDPTCLEPATFESEFYAYRAKPGFVMFLHAFGYVRPAEVWVTTASGRIDGVVEADGWTIEATGADGPESLTYVLDDGSVETYDLPPVDAGIERVLIGVPIAFG